MVSYLLSNFSSFILIIYSFPENLYPKLINNNNNNNVNKEENLNNNHNNGDH